MGRNKSSSAAPGKLRGAEGFELYYSGLFPERWPSLKTALAGTPVYAEWNAGGRDSYFLDPASVFAAVQLPLAGASSILDMCAAPGGKTLVIASRMEKDALLTANERSAARRQRLSQVCASCLPEAVGKRVKVTGYDGARMCTVQTECYDRILLDAPCSSERHVFGSPKYLEEWSPSRIKTLAMAQWALLSSAYRMLAPDGYLLYSTCALSPAENDEVIARLFKKFSSASDALSGKIPVFPENVRSFCSTAYIPAAERTEYGFHILPDIQKGAGPIWFSLVKKTEE